MCYADNREVNNLHNKEDIVTTKSILPRVTNTSLLLTLGLLGIAPFVPVPLADLLAMLGLLFGLVTLPLVIFVGPPAWLRRGLRPLRPVGYVLRVTGRFLVRLVIILLASSESKEKTSKRRSSTTSNDNDGYTEDYADWCGFNWITGKYEVKGWGGDFDRKDW